MLAFPEVLLQCSFIALTNQIKYFSIFHAEYFQIKSYVHSWLGQDVFQETEHKVLFTAIFLTFAKFSNV